MTRVFHRAGSAHAARARSKPPTKVRKHKIIMETITQEKKKLRSVISFEAKAPPGYTFIPAGNPKFTTACKELCRKDGLKVFTVSTTPHQGMHGLSQQVHRIGYHFPSVVVATVCMERGVFLSSTGKVMPYQQLPSYGNTRHFMRERRAGSEVSQNTINTEARDAIKDLFPNIPEKDLNQIIKTAFRKGKKKVGTAVELPLARRVQLAVVAHIRHVYTDYDRLLKLTSFQEARAAVEEPCLARLVQWRGDDENGETVLEDVFREVIVISDDEDDDDTSEEHEQGEEGRDSSVEIVSSNTVVKELPTYPLRYGGFTASDRNHLPDPSEDETSGVRFIPEHSRKRKPGNKKRLDRRGFSRYQAWDRARDRYRETLNVSKPAGLGETAPQSSLALSKQAPSSGPKTAEPFSHARELPVRASHIVSPMDSPEAAKQHSYRDVESIRLQAPMRRPEPPRIIRLSDGSVFQRADTFSRSDYSRPMDPPPLIGPSSLRTHSFLAAEHTRYPTKIYAPYPSIPEETNGSQEYRGHPISERQFPEDRIQGQGIDHKLLMSRKRDSSGLSVDEGQRRQAHIDDLSGKVHVIDINDARCQVPLKHGKIALRNNMGFSRVDRNGETPELYYTSRPGHDRNQFLEDAPFIPNGEGQHSLASAVDMRNDGYLYPSLNHTGPSRPPLERRPTGDSPAIQTTTKKDTFSNLPEHGSFRRVQASEPLTQNGLMGYRSVSKPLVSTADRSSYRIRDDNTNVGPSKLLHIPRPSKILVAPDARDGREFSLHRPVPVHSVPIEQESPERRPVFLDQDTRPSRIYSHDFVRPVHSPSKEKAYRYHPYEPVQDSYTQPGRLPNYLSDTKLGKLPPGRRVAYGSNRSRSASPPIQRSHTRVPVLGPLRGPHTSRPAEHPPPEDARLYVNNYVQGSVNEFRPVERRKPLSDRTRVPPVQSKQNVQRGC